MVAAVGDTPYRIVLILHILSFMAAFAPGFTHPFLTDQSKETGDAGHRTMMAALSANGRMIYAPALILAGLFGFALQGMSSGAYAFSQSWMIAAIIVWVAMNGVLHAMIMPGEKSLAAGDDSARSKLDLGGGLITILLVIMLWLMVFKPGL